MDACGEPGTPPDDDAGGMLPPVPAGGGASPLLPLLLAAAASLSLRTAGTIAAGWPMPLMLVRAGESKRKRTKPKNRGRM